MIRPRVLLIGAGGYGNLYLNKLTDGTLDAELVGICDVSPNINSDVPLYPTPSAFYEKDGADLAIISTPVHTHKAFAITCMQNGSHVLCEKPLCLTEEDAQELMEVSKRTGRFLSLGYQLNYRRDVLALKKDIMAGRFGAPKRLAIMQAYRRGMNYYARNNWAGRIRVDGRDVFDSPFANASAHNFQMMTYLLGKDQYNCCDVVSMEAELYRGNPTVENYDIACMRFGSSCGAELMYLTAHPIEKHIDPYGVFEFEEGTITFDSWDPSFKAKMKNGVQIDYSQVPPGNYVQKLYDALEAIQTGIRPVCGAEADMAHIRAVQMTQQAPVLLVRDELRSMVEEDGDTFVHIAGIEPLFAECIRHFALPGELGKGLA